MRFAEDTHPGFSIQAIIDDGIVIDDRQITRSVLVSTDTLQDWPPCSVSELTEEHMAQCSALQPEIVIIGTGRTQVFPPLQYAASLQ
ncbi:MAG: MTH938/NDUFAF3 family protein, partial [Gammaproteobacteria bacterium]